MYYSLQFILVFLELQNKSAFVSVLFPLHEDGEHMSTDSALLY